MSDKIIEIDNEGFLDPFKERLLNPFIFSLAIAFIARYRIELYDLFIGSTSESQDALNRLTIWDWHLVANLLVVIVLYLASIGLGSFVLAAKEFVKRTADIKFKRIIPVSVEDHSLAVLDNKHLREDLVRQKTELKNSSEHFAHLFIYTIKRNSHDLNKLELVMPHYRGDQAIPFAYSNNHQTKYAYNIFELPNSDFSVCVPILRSGAGHYICVNFEIAGTSFRFRPNKNDDHQTTPVIQIPIGYIDALDYRRWTEIHYFDEGSGSWTTSLPVRKKILSFQFDQNSKMLTLTIATHPNYEAALAMKNLLGQ